MAILALDLGQDCGFAVSDGQSGVWRLKPTRFESAGQRFVTFRRKLSEIGGVSEVVYEEVRAHMGVDAAHAYGGYLAVLQAFCIENNIPYKGVPVATIKKHATGKGSADKKAMIAAAINRFKTINIINDDHADALWLLDYVVQDFQIV